MCRSSVRAPSGTVEHNTSFHLLPLLNFQGMGEMSSLPNKCRCSSCKEPFHREDSDNRILSELTTPSMSRGCSTAGTGCRHSAACSHLERLVPPITGDQAGSLGSVFFIVQLLSSHTTFDPGKQGHQANRQLCCPHLPRQCHFAGCLSYASGPGLGIAHRAGGVKPSLSCCCLSLVHRCRPSVLQR